ncbi:hypothetical protein [Xanthomonas vasicola]|uniref:Uncharacterized protein n=1 Tax=Xanthomonas vasicola TaxID=56459 RepID=A0ABD7SG58_XANVA|nr:hypothetical protein [Xanthomonas vasicola]AZR24869.1 hypothetical protein NX81_011835 [Xanthomonas vasicola]PPV03493.1 hypothetical protein XvhCFBP2543_05955 [Xanthomonas vasicola]TWQ30254.1 hypothetical protein FQJ97_11260 [Xanthomonas vasicola]TWQ42151.1 hypothetical protein FQJ96_00515 [Xanthomonas vasicola]TWQ49742.1 hypothetical protein FQJ94_22185 [Xanthomonas vasicola]
MQLPRKQGRPPNYGEAMSAPERARDYRRKRKQESMAYLGQSEKEVSIAATIDSLHYAFANSEADTALALLADRRMRAREMKS